jgi:hypothetical protein
LKLMAEAQCVIVPTLIFILLTREKESEGWDVEAWDLLGDTGAVQETNEARHSTRDR